MIGPRVGVAVPSGLTKWQKRCMARLMRRAGAGRLVLVERLLAYAIGAGLPVTEPSKCMIIDIGDTTTEVALISKGNIHFYREFYAAGDDFDEAITNLMAKTHNMAVLKTRAERIKVKIGSINPQDKEDATMEVRGRDMNSGLPRKAMITAGGVRTAFAEPVRRLVEAIETLLKSLTPTVAAEIARNGIMITGRGSLLRGLPEAISAATGLPIRPVENPETCVARGALIYLNHPELWRTRKMGWLQAIASVIRRRPFLIANDVLGGEK